MSDHFGTLCLKGLKVPVWYRFQWRKTTVGWLQRVTWKKRYKVRLRNIVLLQIYKMKSKRIIVILKCKKMFLSEKIDKNVQFNSLFFGIPEMFLYVLVRQVAFLSEDLKKLSVWSSVLFTVFTLEMRKREAYRKQMKSNVSVLLNKVSALEHDRFMQVSLYTFSLLFVNTNLSYKHHYQRNGFNTYQFFRCFNEL